MTTDSPAVRTARHALSRAIIATGNAEAEVFRARRREREAEDTLSRALRAQREAENRTDSPKPGGSDAGGEGRE